jgi:hypothetical protein
MMNFDNSPRGATFSAETGAPIQGDVTGYIAQYEADWNAAGALWSTAMMNYAPKEEKQTASFLQGCGSSCSLNNDQASCRRAGGSWSTHAGGNCY